MLANGQKKITSENNNKMTDAPGNKQLDETQDKMQKWLFHVHIAHACMISLQRQQALTAENSENRHRRDWVIYNWPFAKLHPPW